jgi:cephalosporin-C deacetylase-like acetyl esterase
MKMTVSFPNGITKATCGLLTFGWLLVTGSLHAADPGPFHAMGEMAGEVRQTSAILQSRLMSTARLSDGDVPGAAGMARFEISEHRDFQSSGKTAWLRAEATHDGDNVYHDSGDSMNADTIVGMRRKWHEPFAQPQFVKQRKEDFSVLGKEAPDLLSDYLLKQIHDQYDARREAVAAALQSREAFERRLQRLRHSLSRVVGELPAKTPLDARVAGVIEAEGYRIENVVYQSRPKHYVTANVYVPTTGDGPFPGVLIACGHSSLGKAYESYQQAAMLMARNGMVALVYDPIGQGERRSYLDGSGNAGLQHKLDNVNAVLVGRTAVGYQAWDGVRSLDYLLSRPEVDVDKPIGMTGNSGGGAQTMYLMALDDRIGPAAPSCHITTLERNFELGGAGDGCQSAPLTGAEGIDHPDFFAMRAPRPSIILSAEQDYKDIRFTRKTFAEIRKVYELLGQADRLDMFAFDDKHGFSQPRREAAVRWMRRWLFDDSGSVAEDSDLAGTGTQPPEALQATKSGQVLREFPDALSVSELNLRRAKELTSSRATFWRSRDRSRALAEVRELIGASATLDIPRAENRGAINRGDYRIEKLVLRRDDEVPVPALLFRHHRLKANSPAVLYVDGRGKNVDAQPGGAIAKLLSKGSVVLSIDVRGFGETADPSSTIVYAKGDHRTAMWSMHIGRPLLGQRVEDLLTAFEYLRSLPKIDARKIGLVGIGQAGPVALHAAALDSRFASTTLRESIRSWVDDVVAKPQDINTIGHVVPSALLKYDLPNLATVLGAKLKYE